MVHYIFQGLDKTVAEYTGKDNMAELLELLQVLDKDGHPKVLCTASCHPVLNTGKKPPQVGVQCCGIQNLLVFLAYLDVSFAAWDQLLLFPS